MIEWDRMPASIAVTLNDVAVNVLLSYATVIRRLAQQALPTLLR